MSEDEYLHVGAVKDYIRDLLINNIGDKDKPEYQLKAIVKNSIIERVLCKFIFQYRSKDYDLFSILTYFKDQSDNSESNKDHAFPAIREFCKTLMNDLKHNSLSFYSK